MAESQRSAFRGNVDQLLKAHDADDAQGGLEAVSGIACLIFHDFDRLVDAFESIAESMAKIARESGR